MPSTNHSRGAPSPTHASHGGQCLTCLTPESLAGPRASSLLAVCCILVGCCVHLHEQDSTGIDSQKAGRHCQSPLLHLLPRSCQRSLPLHYEGKWRLCQGVGNHQSSCRCTEQGDRAGVQRAGGAGGAGAATAAARRGRVRPHLRWLCRVCVPSETRCRRRPTCDGRCSWFLSFARSFGWPVVRLPSSL